MISINQFNLVKNNTKSLPEDHYSTLPNNTIMKDLDDLFLYIEGQRISPLLNENIKPLNSHAIEDEFVPLQYDQEESKLSAKRCLLPEFECEHFNYMLSQTSLPLYEDDMEELLYMSDFIEEDDTTFSTDESKRHLDVDSHQEAQHTVLTTRRCLIQQFESTNDKDFEFATTFEEDEYDSEYNTSLYSENDEKHTTKNCELDNEGTYKLCMPWYIEDFTYDISNVLYEVRL